MREIYVVLAAIAVMVGAAAVALAQGQRAQDDSKILSGSDFGFRVERMDGNRAAGTLMVKINGQWIEAVPAPKAMAVR
jgi:hypothetical protein